MQHLKFKNDVKIVESMYQIKIEFAIRGKIRNINAESH